MEFVHLSLTSTSASSGGKLRFDVEQPELRLSVR